MGYKPFHEYILKNGSSFKLKPVITDYEQIKPLANYLFTELFEKEPPQSKVTICSENVFEKKYMNFTDKECPFGLDEVVLFDDVKPLDEAEILLIDKTAGWILYNLFHGWGHMRGYENNIWDGFANETFAEFHGAFFKTNFKKVELPEELKSCIDTGYVFYGHPNSEGYKRNDPQHRFSICTNTFFRNYELFNLNVYEKLSHCKTKKEVESLRRKLRTEIRKF